MKSLSTLIVDDHVVVRRGLRALLAAKPEWRVAGEASNGREAIEQTRTLQPDLIISDIIMPQLNGLEAIPQMLKIAPSTRVLILSIREEEELIKRALEAGASGYVLKSDAEDTLRRAIEAVAAGRRFLSPSVARVLLSDTRRSRWKYDESLDRVTRREREVIQLLAEGNSNKQVADALAISIRTAENHRARIMKKLRITSLSDLVRYAIRNNIIQP